MCGQGGGKAGGSISFAAASETKHFHNGNSLQQVLGWLNTYALSRQAGRYYAGCGRFTIAHCQRPAQLVSGQIARIARIARSSGEEDSDCAGREQSIVAGVERGGPDLNPVFLRQPVGLLTCQQAM